MSSEELLIAIFNEVTNFDEGVSVDGPHYSNGECYIDIRLEGPLDSLKVGDFLLEMNASLIDGQLDMYICLMTVHTRVNTDDIVYSIADSRYRDFDISDPSLTDNIREWASFATNDLYAMNKKITKRRSQPA